MKDAGGAGMNCMILAGFSMLGRLYLGTEGTALLEFGVCTILYSLVGFLHVYLHNTRLDGR